LVCQQKGHHSCSNRLKVQLWECCLTYATLKNWCDKEKSKVAVAAAAAVAVALQKIDQKQSEVAHSCHCHIYHCGILIAAYVYYFAGT